MIGAIFTPHGCGACFTDAHILAHLKLGSMLEFKEPPGCRRPTVTLHSSTMRGWGTPVASRIEAPRYAPASAELVGRLYVKIRRDVVRENCAICSCCELLDLIATPSTRCGSCCRHVDGVRVLATPLLNETRSVKCAWRLHRVQTDAPVVSPALIGTLTTTSNSPFGLWRGSRVVS